MTQTRSTVPNADAAAHAGGAAVNRATPARAVAGGGAASLAQSLGDSGNPLSLDVRSTMENRFGCDLSHVRIHADERAGLLADAVGARAFTVRNHVVFGTGRFSPHDPAGRSLLVHELTHVLQQQPEAFDAGLPASLESWKYSRTGDAAEREAERAAAVAPHQEPIVVQERARNVLQADWLGAGIGALVGGAGGAIIGGLIGGPMGALIGGGVGLVAGALIGGLTGGFFPSYRKIVGDSDVQTKITSAWASTEAAANAVSRREEGFWIRWKKQTDTFEVTPTITGPSVGPGAVGSVILGARPADTNSGAPDAIYTVGSFHTHTPTAFRPVGRRVGPSDADHAADKSDDVVGVIYDYVAAAGVNIPAGHPIGSAAQSYHSGPNRRQKV